MKDNKIYTIEEIQTIITPILKEYEVEKAYIFGSYARGEATEESDIDIMIVAPNIKSLFVLGSLFQKIKSALNKEIDITEEKIYTDNLQYDDEYERKAKQIFYTSVKKERRLIYG